MIQFAADTPTLAPAGRPAPPPVTGGDASFAALLTPGTQAAPGVPSAVSIAQAATPIALVGQPATPLPAAPGLPLPVAPGPDLPTDPALASLALVGADVATPPAAIPPADTPTPAVAEVVAPPMSPVAPKGADTPAPRPIPRRFAPAADLPPVALQSRPDDALDTTDRQTDAGDGKDTPAEPAPTLTPTPEMPFAAQPSQPAVVDATPAQAQSTPETAGATQIETAKPTSSSAPLPSSLVSTASPLSLASSSTLASSAPPASRASAAANAAAAAPAVAGSADESSAPIETVAGDPAAPPPIVLPRRREPGATSDTAGHPALRPPPEHGGVLYQVLGGVTPGGAQPTAPAAARPAPIAQPLQASQSEATTSPSAPVSATPLAAAPVAVPSHWTIAPAVAAQPQVATPATPTDVASKPETAKPQPLQPPTPPRPFEIAERAPAPAAAAAAPTWGHPAAERVDADPAIAAPTAAAPVQAPVTVAPTPVAATVDMRREHWPHDMIGQIERLRDAADAVDTRIRLVPDMLGTVEVDVRCEGDTLHVRFQAEQPQTRALLQEAQPRLAEAAESRGLRLGQTSVDAGAGNAAGGERDRPHTPTPRQPSRTPSSRAAGPELTDDARIA